MTIQYEYPIQAIADTIMLEGYSTANPAFGPSMNQSCDLLQKLLDGPLSDPRVLVALTERIT